MATVLIFGAATAVSAAIDLAAAGSAAALGAGLPYYVTMPASEVFAFTAEALLIAANPPAGVDSKASRLVERAG